MALNLGDILLAGVTGATQGVAEEQIRRDKALKKRIEKITDSDVERNKTAYKSAVKEYDKRKETFTPIMAAGDNFTRNVIYNQEYLKLNKDEAIARAKTDPLDITDDALQQAIGEAPIYYDSTTDYDTVKTRSALGDVAGFFGMDVKERPSTEEQIKKIRLESIKKEAEREAKVTTPKFEKGRYTEVPDWAKEGFIWSETLQEWVAKPEPDQRGAADTSAREARIRKNIKDNQRITPKAAEKATVAAVINFGENNEESNVSDLTEAARKNFTNAVNEDAITLAKEGMEIDEARIAAIKIHTQGIIKAEGFFDGIRGMYNYNPENIKFTVSDLVDQWKADEYPRNPQREYVSSLIDSVTTMQPTETKPTTEPTTPTLPPNIPSALYNEMKKRAISAGYMNPTHEQIIAASNAYLEEKKKAQ